MISCAPGDLRLWCRMRKERPGENSECWCSEPLPAPTAANLLTGAESTRCCVVLLPTFPFLSDLPIGSGSASCLANLVFENTRSRPVATD